MRLTNKFPLNGDVFESTKNGVVESSEIDALPSSENNDLPSSDIDVFKSSKNDAFLPNRRKHFLNPAHYEKREPLAFQDRKSESEVLLSYSAKELACHNLEDLIDRLSNVENHPNADGLDKLKVHCRRAVLEYLITARWPDKAHLPLRWDFFLLIYLFS
jgi:hypothetical protein